METQKQTQEQIMLNREKVNVNGKEYSNYFVEGTFKVRGQEVKKRIRMAVPRNDVGMYEVLDMVFEDNKQTPLYKYSKITRDAITGKKNTTYRYEVANEDQDLRAVIVPNAESDKALLNKLYADLNANIIEEEEEVIITSTPIEASINK